MSGDANDGDDKVVRLPSRIIAEVGGHPDEFAFSLAVYGEDLRPGDVSALLGVEPAKSFERGYRVKPHSRPMRHGAWFLQARGAPPQRPDDVARSVLMKLPASPEIWTELGKRFELQIHIAVHTAGWNRGFSFSPSTTRLMAATGATVHFDLYLDDA
jgi:hypothetical protein